MIHKQGKTNVRKKELNNLKKALGVSVSQKARKDLVHLLFPQRKWDLKNKSFIQAQKQSQKHEF